MVHSFELAKDWKPEHEGKEADRLEQDRQRQKVSPFPPSLTIVLEEYVPISQTIPWDLLLTLRMGSISL